MNNPFEQIFDKLTAIENFIIANSNKQEIISLNSTEELLNVEAAAKLLFMPVSTVRYHQRNNSLPYIKIGKRRLYKKDAILKWLNDFNTQNTKSPALKAMSSNRQHYTRK